MGANLLQVKELTKSFGARTLFSDVGFSINEGEHVGVIGPNGAGKSTLFKILLGRDEPEHGEIIVSRSTRVGYLAQDFTLPADATVDEFFQGQGDFPEWELRAQGRHLGLGEAEFEKRCGQLSGGQQMRVKLLQLIMEESNLLLLDEPTNYLDLETVLIVEQFLQSYEGAFLLISHDREFLRRVADHTLEVEAGDVTKFPGNIDDYFEEKQMLREQLERAATNQASRRAQVQAFVDKFRAKASKARQVQSRLKMLEKMNPVEVKSLPGGAVIRLPDPKIIPGKVLMGVENAVAGYGERAIVRDIEINLASGQRLGVVGLNGAGKTTMLKSLAGELPFVKGERRLFRDSTIGYYAQHVSQALRAASTVYQELESAARRGTTRQEILDLAGSLLFSGDDVTKKVTVLSGGERARVALGKILLGGHSILLMDEPTNHLDFYTVSALADALRTFTGGMIVVSHDRAFIARTCTHILEIKDGGAEIYPGTYDEYVWALQHRLQEADETSKKKSRGSGGRDSSTDVVGGSGSYHERKQQESQKRKIEKRMAEIEAAVKASKVRTDKMTAEMSAPGTGDERRRELARGFSAEEASVRQLEDEWLALSEQRDALEKN